MGRDGAGGWPTFTGFRLLAVLSQGAGASLNSRSNFRVTAQEELGIKVASLPVLPHHSHLFFH